jgi:hypothetical protein
MGLDTSHDCWHGAYSAFQRWRDTLAVAAGYKIREATAEELAEGCYFPAVDIDWSQFEPQHYEGEWGTFVPGDDPLLFLIVHSDYSGVIHPAQGIHIARRLEQLLPLLDDTEAIGHIRPSMRAKTRQFIKGLRSAADAGEDVIFA